MDKNLIHKNTENNDSSSFNIFYDLTNKEIKDGLLFFQKKYIYKKYYIYSFLLFIIFLNYLFVFINDFSNSFSFILMTISILSILFIWFNLYNQRRSAALALDMINMKFNINISNDFIKICYNNFTNNYDYYNSPIEIIDISDKFIININKEKIYIIPKRCLDSYQIEGLKKIFKENLKDKYILY